MDVERPQANRPSINHAQQGGTRRRKLIEPTLAGKVLTIILIVAALLLVASMARGLFLQQRKLVKKDQFQAVFLTNGQVYFGKLTDVNSGYVVLNNIYYLQQQDQANANQQQDQAKDMQNVSLIKLGQELHGPEDTMYIQQDKILFWENLKNDGKVAQAIKDQSKQ